MIPLRDNIPSRSTPLVNYAVVGVCTLLFLAQLADDQSVLVERHGMIPYRVWHPNATVLIPKERGFEFTPFGVRQVVEEQPAAPPPWSPWFTLLTCIFLHGGWLHFLGNMWFLYIFGDNVEDRLGHLGYLLFYLGCGVAASAAHLAVNSESVMPTIGASGAIAGVMGAYLLFYPRAMVLSVVPIFFFLEVVVLPAPLFLGIWFLLQFFQGTLAITAVETGGVAWWAHIGGFAAGFVVAAALNMAGQTRPSVQRRLPQTGAVTMYRYRPWND
jgi:membrane associated rhomboid family serine protease